MHNSLHLRDLLRSTNADPLCVERRDPHRLVARDPHAYPAPGEITLDGSWTVACSWPDGAIASLISADFTDFLHCMGVSASGSAHRHLTFGCGAGLGARDFRWQCTPDGITVEAGGVAGLWAAVAWLEMEMRTRRGPFLPAGGYERRAAWDVQISQGPWGGNYSVPDFSPKYLSDDSLRLYAHYGVNSMMIYGDLLCYVHSRILPELNHPNAEAHLAILQDAAQRAARYGVGFSYVVVGPKLPPAHPVFVAHPDVRGTGVDIDGQRLHFLCSGSLEGIAFYRETFGRLFREAPELAGLIFIVAEESFYHCKMWRNHAKAPCPRCAEKDTEEAIAGILAPIAEEVWAAQPHAFLAAWPYTTSGWERPDRVEFIRRLPPDIGLLLSVEKDQCYQKEGYIKQIWDYSVDFTGPSEVMMKAAAVTCEVGRPLFVKTETGIGLEMIQFPYVPAMQRLADKWRGVRSLRPHGVHQSWLFFGMFNSRAEALGLWAAYAPELPPDEFLRQLAVRDFGPAAAEYIIEAWQQISESMGRLPVLLLNYYYTGPSFLGPCHPLVPKKGMALSPVFDGYLFYLQELGETFSSRHIEDTRACLAIDELMPCDGLPEVLPGETRTAQQIIRDEYRLATEAALRAWDSLQQAESLTNTAADRAHLLEEMLLTEAIYRTNRACWNTARFLIARDGGDCATLCEAAMDERENALAALPMYASAPWLEFNRRIDGRFSPAHDMIEEKVKLIEAILAEEGCTVGGIAPSNPA